MNKFSMNKKRALLATSALIAAQTLFGAPVFAQNAPIEEIVVRGRFIPDVMREKAEVASVLVAEDLKRQGDDNAAAALTRVSGLSLVGGRFIYVRGLGERYSSALLNGSPLPSPEPLQRVVPLDLFPSNILAGAVVQKSYAPQYPGEFGGGLINLETVAVPDGPFFSAGLSSGGNVGTVLKRGLTYYGSRTDWTGFDNGIRDTPPLLEAAIKSGKGRIDAGNFTDAELQAIGRDFVNAPLNLMQQIKDVPLNFGMDLSGGDRFDLGWGSVGVVAVAGYKNSWSTKRGVQEEGVLTGVGDINPVTHYDFMSTQNDVALNGLFSAGLEWAQNFVKWTNLYIRNVSKEARSRVGTDNLAGANVRDDFTEWYERDLMSTQLTGKFAIPESDFEIGARAAYAMTNRDTPYEKGIRYRLVGGTYLHDASGSFNYTRFGAVDDSLISGGLDVTYIVPPTLLTDAKVTAGYAYSDNDRSAEQREFRFRAANTSLPVAVQGERVDYLFSDFNIGPNALVLRETTGADGAAAYDAGLRVHGFYGQIDTEVVPYVRMTAGVRYEDGQQDITLRNLFGGAAPASPPARINTYWLPAASVTWNFYEDMQLRVGASKTIGRPQFRELAPQVYLDPDTDRQYIGNPFLVDSELINADARVEWYFAPNQYVAIGGFFKDIDKPVELIINEQGATQQTTFINAPKARLYGAEFEARKYWEFPDMGWISDFNWFNGFNYTYSKSEVIVEAGDVVFPFAGGGVPSPAGVYVQNGAKLQGQSEHLVNLQLGLEDEADGVQATLLLNYASERITTRGRPGFPDLVVDPGVTMDFTFSKTWVAVNGTETELGFEARNLLQTGYEESQTRGGTVLNNAYGIAQSFSVALKRRY